MLKVKNDEREKTHTKQKATRTELALLHSGLFKNFYLLFWKDKIKCMLLDRTTMYKIKTSTQAVDSVEVLITANEKSQSIRDCYILPSFAL